MTTPPARNQALRDCLRTSANLPHRYLWSRSRAVALTDVAFGSALPDLEAMAGRSVLVRTQQMLSAALALIELDGVADRLILCPPDLKDDHLPLVCEMGRVDAVVFDAEAHLCGRPHAGGENRDGLCAARQAAGTQPSNRVGDVYIRHNRGAEAGCSQPRGLTGAIERSIGDDKPPPTWGTFYDIRRYGGLQILLRTLLGDGSLVLADPDEDISAFLSRLSRSGATHITGTPSHWRSVLASPEARTVSPRYIRLSGEIADQAILDSLKDFYPGVPIVHAYASTEAGVCFEVDDGLEGFPARLVDLDSREVNLRIRDDILPRPLHTNRPPVPG